MNPAASALCGVRHGGARLPDRIMRFVAGLTGNLQHPEDGTPQQRRFRDSLDDAFAGVDIVELQSGLPATGRPVPSRRRPAADIVRLPTAAPPGPPPLPPAPPARDTAQQSALAQAMAPVLDEIHALRAEVQRLRPPAAADPAAQRHGTSRDQLALAGMVLLGLAMILFLAAVVFRG